jgi:GNAT superfamily N-acetyltransferase
MEVLTLLDPNDKAIAEAAQLQIDYLSYRSFITKFGRNFLVELYRDWVATGNAILVIAVENPHVRGFVLGIKDKNLLFAPLKKKPFKYLPYVLAGLAKNPLRIVRVVETLFYNKGSVSQNGAELLVIVIDKDAQSKGLGTSLVQRLEDEFRKSNIDEYIVTVHSQMERSNDFYIKNGMTLDKSFTFYGVKWNQYRKRIKL